MTFKNMFNYRQLSLPMVALLLIVGCSKPPFEVAPVTGKVTIDGKPFSTGKVMFAPAAKPGSVESGKGAYGLLNDDGSYTLSTYGNNDGAVVGKHWVTVVKTDGTFLDRKGYTRYTVGSGTKAVEAGGSKIDLALTTAELKAMAPRR